MRSVCPWRFAHDNWISTPPGCVLQDPVRNQALKCLNTGDKDQTDLTGCNYSQASVGGHHWIVLAALEGAPLRRPGVRRRQRFAFGSAVGTAPLPEYPALAFAAANAFKVRL